MKRSLWFDLGVIIFMVVIYWLWTMYQGQCEEFGGTLVRGAGTWECIITRR